METTAVAVVDVPSFRTHLSEGILNTCKRELGETAQFSLQGLIGIKLPEDFMIVVPVAAAEELSFDIPIQTATTEKTEHLRNQLQVAIVTACAELISGESPTAIVVEAMMSITVDAQIIFACIKGTFEMYQMDNIENPGEKLVYAALIKDPVPATSAGDTNPVASTKQDETDIVAPPVKLEEAQLEKVTDTSLPVSVDAQNDIAKTSLLKNKEVDSAEVVTEKFQEEYLRFSGKGNQPNFTLNKELLCIQPGTAEKIMAPVKMEKQVEPDPESDEDGNSDEESNTVTVNVSVSTIEPVACQSEDEGMEDSMAVSSPENDESQPIVKTKRRGRPPKRLIESMDVISSPKKAEKATTEKKEQEEMKVIKLPSPSKVSTRRSKKEEEDKERDETAEEKGEDENKPPGNKRGRPRKKPISIVPLEDGVETGKKRKKASKPVSAGSDEDDFVTPKKIKKENVNETPQRRKKVDIPTSIEGYMCEVCGKSFRFKNSYYTHVKRHKSEEEHPCGTCGKVFALEHDLKKHQIQHTLSKDHVCPICNKGFTNVYMLRRHEKTHEKGEKSFHCEQCPLRFFTKDDLEGHVERVHGNSEPIELRTCEVCNKTFSTEKVLKVHVRTHEDMKYECHICHRKIRTEKALQGHLTMHTRTKPEVCELCGKQYTQKRGLTDHMRIHQGDLPHVCQYCGMKFRRPGLLRVHLYTHGNERSFKCNICPEKAFKSPAGLREHMKVHYGRKRLHKCRHCDKGFIGPSHLKKHEEYCLRRQAGTVDRVEREVCNLGDEGDYVILEMDEQEMSGEPSGRSGRPTTIVAQIVDQGEAGEGDGDGEQQPTLLEGEGGMVKLEEGADQATLMGKLVEASGDQQIILLEQVVELEQVVGQLEAQGAGNIIYLPTDK